MPILTVYHQGGVSRGSIIYLKYGSDFYITNMSADWVDVDPSSGIGGFARFFNESVKLRKLKTIAESIVDGTWDKGVYCGVKSLLVFSNKGFRVRMGENTVKYWKDRALSAEQKLETPVNLPPKLHDDGLNIEAMCNWARNEMTQKIKKLIEEAGFKTTGGTYIKKD